MIYQIRDLCVSLPDMARKPLLGSAPRIDILKGLSFDIEKGAVLGIVGGSGAGKSTLGRSLLRLLEPTSGQIYFEGMDISNLEEAELRPLRRRMQMIFQDPMSSLNPRHCIGRIISGPLELHGFENIPTLIDEVLDMVKLPRDFAQRYPHELSGGQRQRVGIARAIALKPDFILADEIVSGLDVSSQAQILMLLDELVQELNLTVGFISHDMSVIRRLCSRTIVLHQGEIVEQSDTQSLFEAPTTDYTKQLLKAIPLPNPDQPW